MELAQTWRPQDDIEDFLFAFSQNCAHLRDWLLTDKAIAQQDLDKFFATHDEMRVCQDICNATKHVAVDGLCHPSAWYLTRQARINA